MNVALAPLKRAVRVTTRRLPRAFAGIRQEQRPASRFPFSFATQVTESALTVVPSPAVRGAHRRGLEPCTYPAAANGGTREDQ